MLECPYCHKAKGKHVYVKNWKNDPVHISWKEKSVRSSTKKFYKNRCPRCGGIFYTKETYYRVRHSDHKISKKITDIYDRKQTLKKVDDIVKDQLDDINRVDEYYDIKKDPYFIDKSYKSMYNHGKEPDDDVKDLIINSFGKDIIKDIEKDLTELEYADEEIYKIINKLYEE